MSLLLPTEHLKSILDIDVGTLDKMRINTILLDIDNTLAPPDSLDLFDGVLGWIDNMKKAGINIILVSNNVKKRIEPLADILGVSYISFAMKPLPFKIAKTEKLFKTRKENVLVIGDQVFTDILYANLAGVKSILLDPMDTQNEKSSIKMKRLLEKPIRKRLRK